MNPVRIRAARSAVSASHAACSASRSIDASELLAALPESCSLFLEQACPDLALRSHDGTLHNNEQLVTVNGQAIALATTQGDGGLVPESGMCEMADWLEARLREAGA